MYGNCGYMCTCTYTMCFFMNTLILKINNKLICFNKISNEFSKTLYYLCREDHVLKGKILLIFKKTKSEILYLKLRIVKDS